MGEARLDPGALVGVGKVLDERGAELPERGARLLVLGDPAAHAHHLGERPLGDAVAVREAPATMPPRLLSQTVLVLLELPREPRLTGE
jgi:hypothetical protein